MAGLCFSLGGICQTRDSANKSNPAVIKFDDPRKVIWDKQFEQVAIVSPVDGKLQPAYFYKTTAKTPQPLIISLHTWSGNYFQKDDVAPLAKTKNYNYIHPNFRGPNKSQETCCSELVMQDIEESIDYAIANANVDTTKIYVIGVSGGGFATLNMFMRSKHKIKGFSAWASISDLEQWYHDNRVKGSPYAKDILACTGSKNEVLNVNEARKRSPIFRPAPVKKLHNTTLNIFAGVNDGVDGSVPFTHSVKFYNKLLAGLNVKNKSFYVSDKEIETLMNTRAPLSNYGKIEDREICLVKRYKHITLTIFTGGHEMLNPYAFNELVK